MSQNCSREKCIGEKTIAIARELSFVRLDLLVRKVLNSCPLTFKIKSTLVEKPQNQVIQKAMWEKLKLPFFCERMYAFSIPQQDTLWVIDYDQLFHVTLIPEISISTALQGAEELNKVFDDDRSILVIDGKIYPMLGLYGGVPILSNQFGDQLSLQPCQDRLVVLNNERQVKQVIEFSDLSGDWRWATFSSDGRYLLIGVPYDLYVYQWATVP